MKIIRSKFELEKFVNNLKKDDKKIGFVPTMGALHDGHLSLVKIAKNNSDKVIVSIFVNPTQFAAHEDLDTYPRNEQSDLEKLEPFGIDAVYLPNVEDLYPEGFDFKISTGKLGQELEGITRPHFFDGVALVVSKLFMQTRADVAVFGEKDYQQLTIIRNLVKAFDMKIEVLGAPIIREKNGLAMSSRNEYLSDSQKQIAANLNKELVALKQKLSTSNNIESNIETAKKNLIKAGFEKVDYIELRNSNDLSANITNKSNIRILAAAYLNNVRLIDNV